MIRKIPSFEYWSFEILVLFAGLMPDSQLSTSIIAMCQNTEAISYMITYGFAAVISTRVSNELGARNIANARKALTVSLALSLMLGVAFLRLLGLGHDLWVAPLHHQRGRGQRLRLHDAAAHRLCRAGLHTGGTLRRRQGLRVAAPDGMDQPGGLLCHRLVARHPLRIHACLPNQGTVYVLF
ncbi:Protein TRANSPARENT TESTA 12 [Zea mays]|uniref:Protein TRANSPARENT TESTA 12 n=1 Tax=Zea mays TaxID=4577 RepID=A0A1D6LXK8_MAIZE|nr:Protein TRANSPARENT TESTA 12 [Zea mays]